MGFVDMDSFFFLVVIDPIVHGAIFDNRVVKLGNLEAHRQIGIEIIFPIKSTKILNLCIESLPEEDCLVYDFLREQRQSSRLTSTDGTDVVVGWGVEVLFVLATAKDFGGSVEFEVDFESDGDEVVGHCWYVEEG
jgi:hypothetical protein